jgi:spermidine synthase
LAATGAAGLALEITWLRLFGHALGATYPVAGLVLGVYLGGLGAGAWLFGRAQRSCAHALRLLGRLELGAALTAIPIPMVLRWLRMSLPWDLAQSFPVQLGVVALLILPPAVLAGGSLPAAVAALGGPRDATRLYAANTFGGVAGALAAALLPGWLGVATVYTGAVALQLCVGAAAFWLARHARPPAPASEATAETAAARSSAGPLTIPTWALAATAATGGFVLLGMELVWLRLLSTKLHNSSFTFGLVLSIVIASLFLGARLAARLAPMGPRVLPAVWVGGVAALLLSAWTFAALSASTTGLPRGSVVRYLAQAFGLTVAVVAPTCVILGASLPLLWSAIASASLPRRVGRLLAVNTSASVFGSVVTGAVLLPMLGTHDAFRTLATIAALGTVAAARVGGLPRPKVALLATPCLIAALLPPLPSPERFGLPMPRGSEVVATARGANGELIVRRDSRGVLGLRHNAIYGLGSDSAPSTARRMGHLPLLSHGAPERVAFLGLGTGITASAALDHPTIRSIDVLELMPEVVALNAHFAKANGSILSDPRVRVLEGDGRRALASGGPPLDVVVSDLFIPWHPGSADLYSLELFQTVRRRLAPGGLFALWIPAYQIGASELESVMAGFHDAFPVAEAALAKDDLRRPVIGLLGHAARSLPDPVPDARLEALRDRTRFAPDPWLRAPHFHRLCLGPLPRPAARPNTEGWPVVELRAPLSHMRRQELTGPRFTAFRERHFPEGPR